MKKVIITLFSYSCILACNTANKNSIVTNNAFIQKYFETFNKHDWAALANFYADTAQFKDPTLGKGIITQTKQQTIKKYTELNAISPNLHDKIVTTYITNDSTIVVEFISTGTALDSTNFELPICSILTLRNGLIVKDFTYFDNF
jgi:ketosteroid isomerase-like protein